MIDIQKERAAFEVYAKSRIENFCDCKFEHGNYVMLENSRLNRLDKYLLICSMNRSWSAWQAAKAQAVPEGFVLVPREPTAQMCNAISGTRVNPRLIYKAMIEALEVK